MEKKELLEFLYCAKKEAELRAKMSNISTIVLGECDVDYTSDLLNKGMFPLIVSGDSRKVLKLVENNSVYKLGGIVYENGVAYLTPTVDDRFDYICDKDFERIEEITAVRENNGSVDYAVGNDGSQINIRSYISCLMNPVNEGKRYVR